MTHFLFWMFVQTNKPPSINRQPLPRHSLFQTNRCKCNSFLLFWLLLLLFSLALLLKSNNTDTDKDKNKSAVPAVLKTRTVKATVARLLVVAVLLLHPSTTIPASLVEILQSGDLLCLAAALVAVLLVPAAVALPAAGVHPAMAAMILATTLATIHACQELPILSLLLPAPLLMSLPALLPVLLPALRSLVMLPVSNRGTFTWLPLRPSFLPAQCRSLLKLSVNSPLLLTESLLWLLNRLLTMLKILSVLLTILFN